MSYQVLALKYRPKIFQDVVGQDHIIRSLQNSIVNQTIGHAYLLTGTRGVGKTTVARIFAKSLRCLNPKYDANPCGTCQSCIEVDEQNSLDVIEIDGASNNSVEHIRDLVGNVQYLPTSGRYKIYIVDEVHMLSTSAFNAMLKTLEEPPAHVIFIFATTEPEKLLGTVLSRCQRFDFRHVKLNELVQHVQKISEKEEIHFEAPKLVEQICEQGKGSVRDTLSLLDQVLSFSIDNQIDEMVVSTSLGLARISAIQKLANYILKGEPKECSEIYREMIYENVPPKNIVTSLLDHFFSLINGAENPVDFKVGRAELFWVFETLAKDTTWSLESIGPDKVTEIVLQKVALRREFFKEQNQTDTPSPSEIPKRSQELMSRRQDEKSLSKVLEKAPAPAGEPPVSETIPPPLEGQKAEEIKVQEVEQASPSDLHQVKQAEKTWEGFLSHLGNASPVVGSNLEQGNLLVPLRIDSNQLEVNFGLPNSGRIFYEYLSSPETKEKIISLLSSYFEVSLDGVLFNVEVVGGDGQEEKSGEKFLSKAEVEEAKKLEREDIQREILLNNPLIREAQKVFEASPDQVYLKDSQNFNTDEP